mgnify:CR=1 FL=1|tara:strand:+ start:261 stop:668 length:408 start_codon:yes stop_codon:yes gene_type:complete
MAFKMKRTKATFPYKGEHDKFVHKGEYKIVREDLDDGVLGEAENGNTIKVDTSVKPGSKKDKEVIAHEKKHQDEMNNGDLAYDDDSVTDKIAGKTYTRKNGKLIDNDTGESKEEGDPSLPHESRAFKVSNKIKNA